jgi:DNA-binding transcriptional regulator YbjK
VAQLLEAAAEVIVEVGVEAATTTEIAAREELIAMLTRYLAPSYG